MTRFDELQGRDWHGLRQPRDAHGDLAWDEVLGEILHEMVRVELLTVPGRLFCAPFQDPVWSVYECRACMERRAAYLTVLSTYHPPCGSGVRQLAAGLTYDQAMRVHNSRTWPLGAPIRSELGLTPRETTEVLRRFWREASAGRWDRVIYSVARQRFV